MTETPKKRRGFAAMDPQKAREIQSKGGKTAAANGTIHRFDSFTAQNAARKSWERRRAKKDDGEGDPPMHLRGEPRQALPVWPATGGAGQD